MQMIQSTNTQQLMRAPQMTPSQTVNANGIHSSSTMPSSGFAESCLCNPSNSPLGGIFDKVIQLVQGLGNLFSSLTGLLGSGQGGSFLGGISNLFQGIFGGGASQVQVGATQQAPQKEPGLFGSLLSAASELPVVGGLVKTGSKILGSIF